MLRTNSKQARENVLEWLAGGALEEAKKINRFNRENGFEPMKEAVELEKLSSKGEDNADVQKAAAALVWKCFQNDIEGDYRIGREPMQSIFDSWLCGLPEIVKSEDFLLRDACEFLGRILEETPEEWQKYSQDQAETLMIYLIWKTINYVFEHEKKKEGKK